MGKTATLGEYLAQARHNLRLEQKEVADRLRALGVERGTSAIGNWENNRQIPPVEIIPALAKALELKSPIQLYELAGFLADLPGREIVKMLDGLPNAEIKKIETLVGQRRLYGLELEARLERRMDVLRRQN